MKVFKGLLLALAFCAPFNMQAGDTTDETAATAIEISGDVSYAGEDGQMKKVGLGQLFAEGDRLVTGADSSLHLVLADGSSLVLGASTELILTQMGKGGAQSQSVFDLLKGAVNAIVEKLTLGSVFEIHTAQAVAAVKGTQFEVSAEGAESSVTVQEGEVNMMDPLRRRSEAVPRLNRCIASKDRLDRAFMLPKREAAEFEQRWERSRMIHGQRLELMKHFMKERQLRVKELRSRRRHPRAKADDIKERRKQARERFQKAREELKRDRQKND